MFCITEIGLKYDEIVIGYLLIILLLNVRFSYTCTIHEVIGVLVILGNKTA